MTDALVRPWAGVELWIAGSPISQGSMVPGVTKDGRAFVRAASSHSLDVWRKRIGDAAQARTSTVYTGPVALVIQFRMGKPKAAHRGAIWPQTKPDLSKLVRAVEDALKGIVYKDDSQVCRIVTEKRYALGNQQTGMRLKVEPLNE